MGKQALALRAWSEGQFSVYLLWFSDICIVFGLALLHPTPVVQPSYILNDYVVILLSLLPSSVLFSGFLLFNILEFQNYLSCSCKQTHDGWV